MAVLQESEPDFEGLCDLQGYKIAYELRGQQHSEKLIVIQGAFSTRKVFGTIGRVLSDRYAVLLFDGRGLGKSTAGRQEYPCSDHIAEDAAALLEHVWPGEPVHVYGASLGGMAAQKLALMLLAEQKIRSLTLAVTTLTWPYKILLPLWAWRVYAWWALAKRPRSMVPWLMNIMLTREEMASEVIGKAGYKSTLGEQIREAWLKNYDEWYCLRDSKISAIQLAMVFTHFIGDMAVTALAKSGLRILVIVASQDKLIRPEHQHPVWRRLDCPVLELNTGHMMASYTEDIANHMAAMMTGNALPSYTKLHRPSQASSAPQPPGSRL